MIIKHKKMHKKQRGALNDQKTSQSLSSWTCLFYMNMKTDYMNPWLTGAGRSWALQGQSWGTLTYNTDLGGAYSSNPVNQTAACISYFMHIIMNRLTSVSSTLVPLVPKLCFYWRTLLGPWTNLSVLSSSWKHWCILIFSTWCHTFIGTSGWRAKQSFVLLMPATFTLFALSSYVLMMYILYRPDYKHNVQSFTLNDFT